MANAWFRMYAEIEDDPKVRSLPEAMQIRLVWLMCEHCKGVTLSERHRTFQWRCSEQELAATKAEFLSSGFIDEEWNLLNWNKRQYISDSSTERTRRHRERKRTSQERHRNVTVTTPDSDSDSDSETNKTLSRGKRSKREPSPDGMKHSNDPRHIACKEAVRAYWKSKNQDEMPWDGREGKSLGMLLSASPDLTPERITQLLRHRYGSEVNHSDRPVKWLPSLLSYASGPIDRFGHPMDVKSSKDAPRGQPGYSGEVDADKVNESKKFFLDRARERQSRGDPLNQLDKEMLREVKELRV